MNDRVESRKEAYSYIVQKLSTLHPDVTVGGWMQNVSLEDLRLLKEGLADPSAALVDLLKEEMKGMVNDLEIEMHLVEPFKTPL
ncbi:MAG: hypothetical protein JXA46_05210 [Dehalococcoidales bacterium]|nr:hypothetical protein [Dehalococcoidales bacterium]